MDKTDFIAKFSNVFEHSPWLAEQVYENGLSADHSFLKQLHEAFLEVLMQAPIDQQLALIRAHPDLAGKAAVQGELTQASKDEQQSAGLDQCSAAEFTELQQLNAHYNRRFGFPFILAVKGKNRQEILKAFRQRIQNPTPVEFTTALEQIGHIAEIRLQDLTDG